jgi:hypothetical protein
MAGISLSTFTVMGCLPLRRFECKIGLYICSENLEIIMPLDYSQVHRQVKQLGEDALQREPQLQALRGRASTLLANFAQDVERLNQKIKLVARLHDPTLRCALPVNEFLDGHFSEPPQPERATILAADGSQISLNRNAEVDYCLVNVGAIQLQLGSTVPPNTHINSQLFYGEQLYTESGTITDATLALLRDVNERAILVSLAEKAMPPVITFTDGPMELWGAKQVDAASEFQKQLEVYLAALDRLCSLKVITAGYVDKPAANLVVRLLEVALATEEDLPDIKNRHPLRGVSDIDLYKGLLRPGDRSAVFGIQSKSAANYQDDLALHFFYLNVGRLERPWLARVEIPAWVAGDPQMLSNLHAALTSQCRIMGSRPYPYLLHRAHEAAVVSLPEQEQVNQMIILELHRRGLAVGDESQKQALKRLAVKTRFR